MSTDPAGGWRASFLGLGINAIDMSEALDAVQALSRQPSFSFVVTPNVDHVVRLAREPEGSALRRAYGQAALTLCDSRVLALLARFAGEALPVVAGSDLTARLFAERWTTGNRIAVVGASSHLVEALRRHHPAPEIVHIAAPMGLATNTQARSSVADNVERVDAPIVLFACGMPQSELIAAEVAERKKAAGVGLCIGASLEFITGVKSRAPLLMQRLHLEWLHRLLSEPRRLWRRYLVEGPRIFLIVLRWRVSGRPV